MNAAGALLGDRQVWLHGDMQFRVRPACTHLEHVYLRCGIVWMWTIARVAHVEDARQQRVCRIERRHADHDGPEPANLPLAGHGAAVPSRGWVTLPAIVNESEALPFGIFERQDQAGISLADLAVLHALFVETVQPTTSARRCR